MAAKRHYTAELLKAHTSGRPIVCSVAPNVGRPVVYNPRSKGDPKPWRLSGNRGYRYNGRECHAAKV